LLRDNAPPKINVVCNSVWTISWCEPPGSWGWMQGALGLYHNISDARSINALLTLIGLNRWKCSMSSYYSLTLGLFYEDEVLRRAFTSSIKAKMVWLGQEELAE